MASNAYDNRHNPNAPGGIGAWDNTGGPLSRVDPASLQGGSFQSPGFDITPITQFNTAPDPWTYDANGMGHLDPSALSNGLHLQNTLPDINRNIGPVKVGNTGVVPPGTATPPPSRWLGGNSSGALGGYGVSGSGPSYGGTSAMYGFNSNLGGGNHSSTLGMIQPRFNQR